MIVSIHIPKTAGTSFYEILKMNYGDRVSPSFKRKDLIGNERFLKESFQEWDVIHGHFHFKEIAHLMNKEDKLVTWLRDPVDRVVSNYWHFIRGLKNPLRNPRQFFKNWHRRNETLLEYAGKTSTQNVMSKFLDGARNSDFYFVGQQENFEEDIRKLGQHLGWNRLNIPRLNKGTEWKIDKEVREQIEKWNNADLELWNSLKTVYKNDLEC